jgi:hypothetical protein
LGLILFQFLKQLCSGVRGRAPEEPESGEVKCEEGEFGADVVAGDLLEQGTSGRERERLAGIELNEQHGALVVTSHGHTLAVQAAVVQGADQVTDALALHAHFWRQDVISNL